MKKSDLSVELVFALCEKTFPRLWGYRRPLRPQGETALCDFLVVCEPHALILEIIHLRDKRNAEESALEEKLRSTATRIQDAEAILNRLTAVRRSDGTRGIPIPPEEQRRIYRVSVVLTEQVLPVSLSRDFGNGFVHVLDEAAIESLLRLLDTPTDVFDYLQARDRLLSSNPELVVTGGEKNLLALYLGYVGLGLDGFPSGDPPPTIGDGEWAEMRKSEPFRRMQAANRTSYVWDRLIEHISEELLAERMDLGNDLSSEPAVRAMALENRFARRGLAEALTEFRELALRRSIKARMLRSPSGTGFVFFAPPPEYDRGERIVELQARCFIARGSLSDTEKVAGIGMNVHPAPQGFATDLILFSSPEWSAENQASSERLKNDTDFFKTPIQHTRTAHKYPRDDEPADLPGGLETWHEGPLQWTRFGDNADPAAFKDAVIERGEAAEGLLERFADKFLRACREADPVELISQIQFFNLIGPDQFAAAADLATKEALIDFLASLALTLESPKTGTSDWAAAYDLFQDLPEVRNALNNAYLGRKFQESSVGEVVDEARLLLGLERLFDRMEGFPQHLNKMYTSVFERLHKVYIEELGFSPGDIPMVVAAVVDHAQSVFNSVAHEATDGWTDPRLADMQASLPRSQQQALSANFLMHAFIRRTTYLDLPAIASNAGLPEYRVAAVLEAMSASWGANKEYRSLLEGSPFRASPVLKTSRGFSTPLPWSPLHEGFRWFDNYLVKGGLAKLRKRHLKQRDQATESMALQVLSSVFGEDRVYGSVEYEIDGNWYECDGFVALEPHALIVEAKAHSMTTSGRRGAPKRVERKAEQLVARPIEQGRRLAETLISGGCQLRDRATKKPIALEEVDSATIISVSFERVDPLHHLAGRFLETDTPSVPFWCVCIADLLMVADLLDEPTSFVAYAWARSQILNEKKLHAITEADLLAGFLERRLRDVLSIDRGENVNVFIGFQAHGINEYFIKTAAGLEVDKPTTGIPKPVVEALQILVERKDHAWPKLVKRAYAQDPKQWEALVEILRCGTVEGGSEFLAFDDPPLQMKVTLGADSSDSTQENELVISFT